MIRSVLVANRGEIASRIARTCREMGIRSILASAEIEAGAWPRRNFDEALILDSSDPRSAYLDVGAVIDAAKRSGAEAVHPGYGFLSERADLAAACRDAGIRFIGPPAAAIEAMGSKARARSLMEKLGVPVVPGYHGDDQSDERFGAEAAKIGYPILVKASAGGGGKGMKIARTEPELLPSLQSARREAAKAFGDERLLLEKYVEEPRHVEIQIFGDENGEIVHLYERDCSIQRRHQKVIEESPAPRFSEELRQRMGTAAIEAARGVGYVNAGTVEFILTPSGEFYFLEMNTRLQVEHPVTEMVLGIDLVRAQIEIASGRPLPWKQADLVQRGHAIEARIYAEDPDEQFLPQMGTLLRFDAPAGPGIRVDSGVGAGSEVTMHFDPMLAKVIAFGATREGSVARLHRALGEMVVFGVTINSSYLRRILRHPRFMAGEVSTGFLAEHEASLRRDPSLEVAALAAVLSSGAGGKRAAVEDGRAAPPSVWDSVGPWGR